MVRIESVVCAVDFSEVSRGALREAVRVVRQFKATLHVAFVADPLLAPANALSAPAAPDLEEELKQFVLDTPDRELPVEPLRHVVTGHPAEEIVALADHVHADLIVMGSRGLTNVAHALFGSTTSRVLRRARIPLLIVPPIDASDRARDLSGLGSIFILCDFRASATFAARVGTRLATAVGARVVLVHVVPTVSAPPSWSARVEAAMERRTDEVHHSMCGVMWPFEEHGPVESVIVRGNVAAGIVELARTHHAGLIVIGLETDARGPQPGSTAYAVISSTAVPVLTIPAPVTDSDMAGELWMPDNASVRIRFATS